jgi:Galactose oxidase, central domain
MHVNKVPIRALILYRLLYLTARLPQEPDTSVDSPAARSFGQAALWNGQLLVHGGFNFEYDTDLPDTWAYNFVTKKWKLVNAGNNAGEPGKRYKHSMAIVPVSALHLIFFPLGRGSSNATAAQRSCFLAHACIMLLLHRFDSLLH